MITSHIIRQRRARLLREIAHFAAAIAATPDPTDCRVRAAHNRAARCLAARARRLAELGWPKSDA